MFKGNLGDAALQEVQTLEEVAQADGDQGIEKLIRSRNERRRKSMTDIEITNKAKQSLIAQAREAEAHAKKRSNLGKHFAKFSVDYVAPEAQRALYSTMTAEVLINSLASSVKTGFAVTEPKTERLVGVVNMQDFMHHVILMIPVELARKVRTPEGLATITDRDMNKLKALGKDARQVPCGAIKSVSKKNNFVPAFAHELLPEIIEMMATGVSQVPIETTKGVYRSSLDHLSVLKLVAAQLDHREMKRLRDTPLTFFNLHVPDGSRRLIKISSQANVLAAMEQLFVYRKKADVLTIMDKKDNLIGMFGADQLTSVFSGKRNPWFHFLWTLEVFLRKSKKTKTAAQFITCSMTATIGEVIQTLASARKTHLFVVDEQKKPLTCISTTDIFHILAQRFSPTVHDYDPGNTSVVTEEDVHLAHTEITEPVELDANSEEESTGLETKTQPDKKE